VVKKTITIQVQGDYITLGQALKLAGVLQTGGEARAWLAENVPIVCGEPDQRRGRKLRPGDTVELPDGTRLEFSSE
jgi:ribosome-associated protein YbcJ (S4-like RNA binding protein)